MACPTCDHTMQNVARGLFHCPRCGTLASNDGPTIFTPTLVVRCSQFMRDVRGFVSNEVIDAWNRLGISESIATPENRGG